MNKEDEWMTFGEMLDHIQIGQVVEPDDKAYATFIRTPMGLRILDRWTRKPWDGFVAITYSLFRLKYRFTDEKIEIK
jgi:hypothetical protein